MTQTQHDAAVKRIRYAGGRWPPKMARTRWPGSGRYVPVKCAECGQAQRPMAERCALCGEDLRP